MPADAPSTASPVTAVSEPAAAPSYVSKYEPAVRALIAALDSVTCEGRGCVVCGMLVVVLTVSLGLVVGLGAGVALLHLQHKAR